MTRSPRGYEAQTYSLREDFHQQAGSPYRALLAVAVCVPALLAEERRDWVFYGMAALMLLAAADELWHRWHPLVSVLPWGLQVRKRLLSPTHELAFPQIASWDCTEHVFGLLTTGGKRIYVSIAKVSKPDRERLSSLLVTHLGPPSPEALRWQDVTRRERRLRALLLGAVVLGTVLLFLLT